MPYKNLEQKRKYQREIIAKTRSKWFEGKVCARCGTSEKLELDHINPEEKVSHRIWNWSKERRDTELAKCQPLCSSCHKDKTKEERFALYKHGTYSCWSKLKCRCEPCVMAQRTYKRDYRARTGIH